MHPFTCSAWLCRSLIIRYQKCEQTEEIQPLCRTIQITAVTIASNTRITTTDFSFSFNPDSDASITLLALQGLMKMSVNPCSRDSFLLEDGPQVITQLITIYATKNW
ncbi:MAG: hypothetical protein EZS28_055022, partial [Streblomastix strix]